MMNPENNEETPLIHNSNIKGIFSLNNDISILDDADTSNNWTHENKLTLANWKNSLSKASFVYQYAKDIKKQKLNKLSLVSLILTVIATAISGGVSLAISSSEQQYKIVALVCSIIVFGINSAASIINSIINKIYRLDTDVEAYTKYIENIDILFAEISSTFNLSPRLREDALIFIPKENKKYDELIRKGPDIDNSLYLEAIKKYDKFIKIQQLNII